MPPDEALIVLFYNGSEEGFEELCRRWYASGKLIDFFERGGALGHGVELAQAAMLAVYHGRSNQSERFAQGTFSTYIFQIARSILMAYVQRARPITAVFSECYSAAHPANIQISGPCRLKCDGTILGVDLPPKASLLDLALELEGLSLVRASGMRFRIVAESEDSQREWRLYADRHRNSPPIVLDSTGRNLLPNMKDAVLDLRGTSDRPRCDTLQSRIGAIQGIQSVLGSMSAPVQTSIYRHVYNNDSCAQIASEIGQSAVQIWEGCFKGLEVIRAYLVKSADSYQIEVADVEAAVVLYYRYFHVA